MQVRCWVSNASVRTTAIRAFEDAKLPIAEVHEKHVVYRNLPLETSDEELITELKVLLRALLPTVEL